MSRSGTWLACGGLAAAIVGVAALLDNMLGGHGLLLGLSLVVGLAYLVGTFTPNSRLFGSVLRTRTDLPQLALTFDDGPDPRFTPAISSLLAGRGQRATFFVLGAHAQAYPQVVAQLAADGHEVASHGNAHELLAFSSPDALRKQLEAVERAVEDAIGKPPAPLFRAPHGVRSPWLVHVVRRSGYTVCGWEGRVFDTSSPGIEKIVARVQRLLQPGAVVLLHDGDGSGRAASREETLAALRPILDELDRRGLRSVPLSELALNSPDPSNPSRTSKLTSYPVADYDSPITGQETAASRRAGKGLRLRGCVAFALSEVGRCCLAEFDGLIIQLSVEAVRGALVGADRCCGAWRGWQPGRSRCVDD